jgi:hypothetical protein
LECDSPMTWFTAPATIRKETFFYRHSAALVRIMRGLPAIPRTSKNRSNQKPI